MVVRSVSAIKARTGKKDGRRKIETLLRSYSGKFIRRRRDWKRGSRQP